MRLLTTFLTTQSKNLDPTQPTGLRKVPHIKVAAVASRWQHVGDLIGLGFEPHTSRTRGRRLTLAPSGRLNAILIHINNENLIKRQRYTYIDEFLSPPLPSRKVSNKGAQVP